MKKFLQYRVSDTLNAKIEIGAFSMSLISARLINRRERNSTGFSLWLNVDINKLRMYRKQYNIDKMKTAMTTVSNIERRILAFIVFTVRYCKNIPNAFE